MDACDRFELAIEMRLHDALPPDEGAELDAHLATCERCRRFERRAMETQRVLTGTSGAAAASVDPGRVWAGVERLAREDKARIGRVALLQVVLVLGAGFAMGNYLVAAASILPVSVLVLSLLVWRGRAQARELALVGRSQEDVLALYRRILDRRIARLSRMCRVLPVIALMELTLTRPGAPWPKSLHREGMMVFAVVLSLFLVGQAVYLGRKVLPALRREREALES